MNDRELLEMAAKAAGYELTQWPDEDFVRAHMGGDWRPKWNPLTDDGDAFRLAGRMNILLGFYDSYVACHVLGHPNIDTDEWHSSNGNDQMAAARRAITRAAAEIGRAML